MSAANSRSSGSSSSPPFHPAQRRAGGKCSAPSPRIRGFSGLTYHRLAREFGPSPRCLQELNVVRKSSSSSLNLAFFAAGKPDDSPGHSAAPQAIADTVAETRLRPAGCGGRRNSCDRRSLSISGRHPVPTAFAPFWPPNVVLFCALLLAARERWWAIVGAVFPAHVLAEMGMGMPRSADRCLLTNCALAVSNALAVRWLLVKPPWFASFRKTAIYIAVTRGPSARPWWRFRWRIRPDIERRRRRRILDLLVDLVCRQCARCPNPWPLH